MIFILLFCQRYSFNNKIKSSKNDNIQNLQESQKGSGLLVCSYFFDFIGFGSSVFPLFLILFEVSFLKNHFLLHQLQFLVDFLQHHREHEFLKYYLKFTVFAKFTGTASGSSMWPNISAAEYWLDFPRMMGFSDEWPDLILASLYSNR